MEPGTSNWESQHHNSGPRLILPVMKVHVITRVALLLVLSPIQSFPVFSKNTTLICKHGIPQPHDGSCLCPSVFGGPECGQCLCKGGTCQETNTTNKPLLLSHLPLADPIPSPNFYCTCPLNFDPATNCVHCLKSFRGPNCALSCSNAIDCSGQGTCINMPNEEQVCDCNWPWTGSMCRECGCFNHGSCSNSSKYAPPLPDLKTQCICREHFKASTGCVTCEAGYFVKRDKIKPFEDDTCNPCPGGAKNPCNGRGECDQLTGNCTCVHPYHGHACEFSPDDPTPGPSSGGGGGNTPLIPTHLAIGYAGLIAVASSACILGVAAVAFVSSLHNSNKKREREIREARENRRKRREEYDSRSVFSAQFSPPAQRVDDDMMRHLLGPQSSDPNHRNRANSNPEPLFLSQQQQQQQQRLQEQRQQQEFENHSLPTSSSLSFPLTSPTSSSPLSSSTLSRPLLSGDLNSTEYKNSDETRHSNVDISNTAANTTNTNTDANQRLSFVLDDHFKRPTAPLPGLNPNVVNNQKKRNTNNTTTGHGHNIPVRDRSDESFSSPTTAREWLVDVNNLVIHEQIGRGGSCLVYRATYGAANDPKTRVAVKSLALPSPKDFHTAEEYEYDLQDFRQEAKMLAKLRHTNIVQFYGIAFTPKTLLLVEEYCPLSLHDLMARPLQDTRNVRDNVLRRHILDTGKDVHHWDLGNFTSSEKGGQSSGQGGGDPQQQQQQKQRPRPRMEEKEDDYGWWAIFVPVVVEQIARGMAFLHQSHTIHRDLKPENVLLNEKGIFKICDFGVSRELDGRGGRNGSTSPDSNHQHGRKQSGGSSSNKRSGRMDNNTNNTNNVRGSPVGRLKSAALSITGQVGTPVFMAPEMFSERPTLLGPSIGYAIDVYSFGMLTWAIWSREQPYHRLLLSGEISNPYQIALRVTQHQLRPTLRFRDHKSMHVPDMPHDIEVLIETCWNQVPSKRPSFLHILKILGASHEVA